MSLTKRDLRNCLYEEMEYTTKGNTGDYDGSYIMNPESVELVNDPKCFPKKEGEPYNRPIKINGSVYYISRSITVSLYVYCKNKRGELCVLANQRGQGAQNAQMKWNIPAGYLDYGESVEEAAARETYEETGVKVPINKIEMMGINSHPGGRRQDVSVRFSAVLDGTIDKYPVDISNCEPGEVADAGWIPLSQIGKKEWAYGQDHKIIPQAETMFGRGGKGSLSAKIAELNHELTTPKARHLFKSILKDLLYR